MKSKKYKNTKNQVMIIPVVIVIFELSEYPKRGIIYEFVIKVITTPIHQNNIIKIGSQSIKSIDNI